MIWLGKEKKQRYNPDVLEDRVVVGNGLLSQMAKPMNYVTPVSAQDIYETMRRIFRESSSVRQAQQVFAVSTARDMEPFEWDIAVNHAEQTESGTSQAQIRRYVASNGMVIDYTVTEFEQSPFNI